METSDNKIKITVKNSELNEKSISAINNLLSVDINASTAFKLSRIIKEISSIFEDKKMLSDKLIDKWAERDDDGNMKIAEDELGNPIPGSVVIKDIKSFNSEMEDLDSVENVLQYDKIEFDDLGLETAKIQDIMILDFLFY
jgi:hypothetical protein